MGRPNFVFTGYRRVALEVSVRNLAARRMVRKQVCSRFGNDAGPASGKSDINLIPA